ncbi:antitoxin Xre/MbcA/ParS toxin-binding domain-containing protein [Geobacter argillaceus]|uniref:antitoxin Xre/MbcA/ParS toxin-binding domain-containing protein n=1 Tax=Geobacter argillaceus TaxID=345631 RepID=UPI00147922CD|nr:antitoxin Xre/MbcA/ParS toxin-binding domain-containing protein [Geobacter argillaceus]
MSLIFPAIPANHIPDPIELVSFIRGGASTGSIGRVAEFLQVPKTQLYRLLRIPPASRRATLGVNETDQLVQIARVYAGCLDFFGDPAKAARWMMSPNLTLGDLTPFDLLDTNEGIRVVEDSLKRLDYGVFC